jgi:hypothetical protein
VIGSGVYIVEGRPLARSEDKYRRVCRKLIHHDAYRTKPHLTVISERRNSGARRRAREESCLSNFNFGMQQY